MSNVSCEHLRRYREANGKCSYEILHAFYVSCIAKDSLKRKARDCVCVTDSCKLKYQRIHACLSCIHFGCFSERHIHKHAKDKNHYLAIDTNYGHVYCFLCSDYQYDPEFENIARNHYLIATHRKGIALKWQPNEEEMTVLRNHQLINVSNIGLRGIVNMGNTCYISVILQSLIHAPLFRDYFLSLQHHLQCSSQTASPDSQDKILEPICFACEMTDIVQELFSGKTSPFVPYRLLHLLWTSEDRLKGYAQQDAHDFFLALLENLHLNCQGSNANSVSDHLCKCIIDTIFTGYSKYVYTCQECNNEYAKKTPFKDLTLTSQASTTTGANDNLSLNNCLENCVRSSSVVKEVHCTSCQEKKSFNVQMNLMKLPFVISFLVNQLHEEKKFIEFPEILDMSPYLYKLRPHQSNSEDRQYNGIRGNSSNTFYLFAVVEHTGIENSGHYVCYVRQHKKRWFSCNDNTVKPIVYEDVCKKKAYLLFYHKEVIEYEEKKKEEEKIDTT